MKRNVQFTLAVIKPDITVPSVARFLPSSTTHHRPESILEEIERSQHTTSLKSLLELIRKNDFKVVDSRWISRWNIEEAEDFYREHEGRFFFQRLIAFMTSGPLVPMVLAKENAIQDWRKLMGPTHLERAKREEPTSLRANFASSDTRNATHGSDSEENALREIKFFFPSFSEKEALSLL